MSVFLSCVAEGTENKIKKISTTTPKNNPHKNDKARGKWVEGHCCFTGCVNSLLLHQLCKGPQLPQVRGSLGNSRAARGPSSSTPWKLLLGVPPNVNRSLTMQRGSTVLPPSLQFRLTSINHSVRKHPRFITATASLTRCFVRESVQRGARLS